MILEGEAVGAIGTFRWRRSHDGTSRLNQANSPVGLSHRQQRESLRRQAISELHLKKPCQSKIPRVVHTANMTFAWTINANDRMVRLGYTSLSRILSFSMHTIRSSA
jgi:hypothetical protein